MKTYLYILFSFSVTTVAQTTFQTNIAKNDNTSPTWGGRSIVETISGEIYVVGSIKPGGWYSKCRLLKLDHNGAVVWDTTYSQTIGQELNPQIIQADQSGLILVSDSYSFPIADEDSLQDILVWKINSNGIILWQKVLSARNFIDCSNTKNGDYLIAGTIHETKPNQGMDAVIYRLDRLGNVIYSKRLGQQKIDLPWHSDQCISVQELDETTYVTGDHYTTNDLTISDGLLYALDRSGNLKWDIFLAHSSENEKVSINSVFKFDGRYYFNTNSEMYEFDPVNGNYWDIPDSLAIGFYGSGYNFAVACGINRLTTIGSFAGVYTLNHFENIIDPYYENSIPVVSGSFSEMIASRDGGYLILTSPSQQMQITKTDCLGNVDHWNNECNSKIREDKKLIVYPNPSENEIRIDATFDFNEVVIFSPSGQYIYYDNPCGCRKQVLDISNLAAGVYVVRISSDENFAVSKFVKV